MGVNNKSDATRVAPSVLTFNVTDQQDVAKLLGYIRGSQLDPEEKSHTRDLILDFTHHQEQTILDDVNQILKFINVSAIQKNSELMTRTTKSEIEKPKQTSSALGYTRHTPTFSKPDAKISTPNAELASTKAVDIEPNESSVPVSEPVDVVKIESKETPVATKIDSKSSDSIHVAVEKNPATELAEDRTTTQPKVDSVAPVEQPSLKKEAKPISESPPIQPRVTETNNIPMRNLEPQRRIQEIKKYVNERVGNPVNLIDSHNEIGREYMNALLDAMKKTNNGQAMEIKEAMIRLEEAFSQVKSTLENDLVKQSTSAVAPRNLPPKPSNQDAVAASPAKSISSPKPTSIEESVAPVPDLAPANQPKVSNVPLRSIKVPQTAVAKAGNEKANCSTEDKVKSLASRSNQPLRSLAESNVADSLPPLPDKKPEAAPQAQQPADALQNHEVTTGLEQLLSEWNLFKSSGIFGTGPNGREHPLYQRIASLPMASIVAGRYEGVTPEIRQSIADYMNGWRYEQGIVHELSENFEHYLRRVIATVLEKQVSKKVK